MCNFGSAEFDLTKLAEFDGSSPVLMGCDWLLLNYAENQDI
jgi:hypothetical protein